MAKITWEQLVALGERIEANSTANLNLAGCRDEIIGLITNLGDGDAELGYTRLSDAQYDLKAAKVTAAISAMKDAADNL